MFCLSCIHAVIRELARFDQTANDADWQDLIELSAKYILVQIESLLQEISYALAKNKDSPIHPKP